MAYNRYRGNSGRMERVEDGGTPPRPLPPPPAAGAPSGTTSYHGPSLPPPEATSYPGPSRPSPPPPAARRPPGPLTGMSGELGRLLNRLSPMKLDTEDLLLVLILYLLYRESRDEEFLIMLGGYLFF